MARSIESGCEMLQVLADTQTEPVLDSIRSQAHEIAKELHVIYQKNAPLALGMVPNV